MNRALCVALIALTFTTGCAANDDDEDQGAAAGAMTQGAEEGVVYFHGMSKLGFAKSDLQEEVGSRDLLAPSMSDTELQAVPSKTVLGFLQAHERGVVGGYSLGRVPVYRLMKMEAKGVSRVVMIDPTYDSATGIGKGIGGGIARTWLDGDDDRTFLLVYGDATTGLEGERSYVAELTDHPRAEICHVPGDHARFRRSDIAYALVAANCNDLKAHLDK